MSSLQAGWITPAGDIIECDGYNHIKSLLAHGAVKDIPGIGQWINQLEEVNSSCLEDSQSGEHPAWHRYEMAESDAADFVYPLLLNRGFIRIGTWLDEVCFEGRPEHLKNRHQMCVDLAESHGMVAKFEPQ